MLLLKPFKIQNKKLLFFFKLIFFCFCFLKVLRHEEIFDTLKKETGKNNMNDII